ncbi:MAG: hypothetical protein PVS3B3_10290 [Ktedonobacteraceae bacterium]
MAKNFIRYIRYILPLMALLLIATYLILSPATFTHAAASTLHDIVAPAGILPDVYWPMR